MAFTIHLDSTAAPERLWEVLTDFPGHERFVPATTMRTDPGPPRVGWELTARTGRGMAAVPDPMVLTIWEPPTRFRLVKIGPILTGWAEASVVRHGEGSQLTWTEQVVPRGLPRALRRPADAVACRAYRRVLAGFVAEAERLTAASGTS